jgi:hypothetical protein
VRGGREGGREVGREGGRALAVSHSLREERKRKRGRGRKERKRKRGGERKERGDD